MEDELKDTPEESYHKQLGKMISKVNAETKWRDIFKIVEEAQRRLKAGEEPAAKFITSLSERPTYIKHWESSLPDGNQIRILSENGLEIINCRWKNYQPMVADRWTGVVKPNVVDCLNQSKMKQKIGT